MRHGSVTYFQPDGKPLAPDDVPLNAHGIQQAEAAGRLFASQGVKFDRVIVSGLPRTIETAERVMQAACVKLTIEHQAALQEIRSGRLADIPDHELQQAFTAATDGEVKPDARFLGGESVGEFLQRVVPAFDAIRADTTWANLLLVLHGGVNRALLSYLLTGEARMLGGFEQTPACINVIDCGAEKRDVVLRAANLSPLDWLQPHHRQTTMEVLLGQYARYRQLGKASHV
ncbi:MAG: histidine phosphatase family protein [Betaproteobacteria bacterium]|nr:histidine phosphatase family protein [Betaproteobacteria bacterium]